MNWNYLMQSFGEMAPYLFVGHPICDDAPKIEAARSRTRISFTCIHMKWKLMKIFEEWHETATALRHSIKAQNYFKFVSPSVTVELISWESHSCKECLMAVGLSYYAGGEWIRESKKRTKNLRSRGWFFNALAETPQTTVGIDGDLRCLLVTLLWADILFFALTFIYLSVGAFAFPIPFKMCCSSSMHVDFFSFSSSIFRNLWIFDIAF